MYEDGTCSNLADDEYDDNDDTLHQYSMETKKAEMNRLCISDRWITGYATMLYQLQWSHGVQLYNQFR